MDVCAREREGREKERKEREKRKEREEEMRVEKLFTACGSSEATHKCRDTLNLLAVSWGVMCEIFSLFCF